MLTGYDDFILVTVHFGDLLHRVYTLISITHIALVNKVPSFFKFVNLACGVENHARTREQMPLGKV